MTDNVGIVVHYTFSRQGGAGNAAQSISQALVDQGVDSRVEVSSVTSISKSPTSRPGVTVAALIDKILGATKDASLFSPVRGNLTTVNLKESAILHLHWIVGAIGLATVNGLVQTRLLFWTLHDYRPLTGGCHYPRGCEGFKVNCTDCPQARPSFKALVSQNRHALRSLLSSPNLTIVAPSEGMRIAAEEAGARNVVKIPNPLDSFWLASQNERISPQDGLRFIFVAAKVDDPIKGLPLILRWWDARPNWFISLTLVGVNSLDYANTSKGVVARGPLDREGLRDELLRADVLVFASEEDNAPNVIAEAVGCGLPILCLGDKMRAWLELDGTPLLTQSNLESVRTFEEFVGGAFREIRRHFLANRDPAMVARAMVGAYRTAKRRGNLL